MKKNKNKNKIKIKIIILGLTLIISLLFITIKIVKTVEDKNIVMAERTSTIEESSVYCKNEMNLRCFKSDKIFATDIAYDFRDFCEKIIPNIKDKSKNLSVEEQKELFNNFENINGKVLKIDEENFIKLIEKINNLTSNLKKDIVYCDFEEMATNAAKAICFYTNGEKLEFVLMKKSSSSKINITIEDIE